MLKVFLALVSWDWHLQRLYVKYSLSIGGDIWLLTIKTGCITMEESNAWIWSEFSVTGEFRLEAYIQLRTRYGAFWHVSFLEVCLNRLVVRLCCHSLVQWTELLRFRWRLSTAIRFLPHIPKFLLYGNRYLVRTLSSLLELVVHIDWLLWNIVVQIQLNMLGCTSWWLLSFL